MIQREGSPLVFNIHRFALDDGPGIRATVFLKGCPLACEWCHNPESMRGKREIAFHPRLCIHCGDCEAACPEGAIDRTSPDRIVRERCKACGACTEACPATALRVVGRYYPVSELVEMLLRDRVLYQASGGGVTFSGGEPTLHMDYVADIASELKRRDIHIALQTSGTFNLMEFREKLLPVVDLIFFDLKLLDPQVHKRYTGRSNDEILHNLSALSREAKVKIIPRTPLVPEITATAANLNAIAGFLRTLGHTEHVLLPWTSGGASKALSVGRRTPDLRERRAEGGGDVPEFVRRLALEGHREEWRDSRRREGGQLGKDE